MCSRRRHTSYFDMIGEVKCIEDARYIRSEHHFGTVKVNPDWSLNETESLYKVGFEHHGSPNKKTVTHTLKVPLSQIENGPPFRRLRCGRDLPGKA